MDTTIPGETSATFMRNPLDRFVMSLERALAPTNDTTGGVDADEYPAWREAEDLAADDEQ